MVIQVSKDFLNDNRLFTMKREKEKRRHPCLKKLNVMGVLTFQSV